MIFKLDNVCDLAMARWAAAEGFSYITFNFERDSNYCISPKNASQISAWVSGPKIVARFSLDELAQIHDIYEELKFDVLEMDLTTFQKIRGFEEFSVILRTGKDTFEAALELQADNQKILALSVEETGMIFNKKNIEKCLVPDSEDISKYGHLPMGMHLNAGRQNEPDHDFFDFFEKSRHIWSKSIV